MKKLLGWMLSVILKTMLIGISTVLMVYAFQQIMIKTGNEIIKSTEENNQKIIQSMKNKQNAATPPVTWSATPLASDWVFVKGKSLKECAPNNYINETALRCTKDHYEPRQYGNH